MIGRIYAKTILLILISISFSLPAKAQYFGRNKPQYKKLKFKVDQTPHFEIYNYLPNDSLVKSFGGILEKWYALHQSKLRDTIKFRNPVILYENHAEFQQTPVVGGIIGSATGGVTEAFKNRIVMPIMPSRAQTSHVAGHELVHAFQYNMLRNSDSVTFYNVDIPLWMIEGLAEYLSIGNYDPNTALWMRDAIKNDKVPTIRQMTYDPKFFPYRYGHALWSYIIGTWGDSIITPLFMATASSGIHYAIEDVLKMNEDSLHQLWKMALMDHYGPLKSGTSPEPFGKKLISVKNGGEMNLSPAISPNGKYIAYFSERNLFSIDLFLADAETGRTIRKLTSPYRGTHIDEISFIESAGTWAPDNRRFAYTVFEKGRNYIYILDVFRKKTIKKIEIPGVPAFSNPSWSPDGRSIVVSGMAEGQSDLYLYSLETSTTVKLTNDVYSDLQPAWSPDGKKIIFSTDQENHSNPTFLDYNFNLAIYDLSNNTKKTITTFPGANNLNPIFDGNDTVYFLSDQDGFRNLYSYSIKNEKIVQQSNFFTGISGITDLSTAISYSKDKERIIYSYYIKGKYEIYSASKRDLKRISFKEGKKNIGGGFLPPVIKNIKPYTNERYEELTDEKTAEVKYKPKFKLDYISNIGVGIAAGRYGAGFAGGINALFSDMLSNHQLYSGLSINGRLVDFAAAVYYVNQQYRINFGAGASHIPFTTFNEGLAEEILVNGTDTLKVTNYRQELLRIFEDQVGLYAAYPLSQTRRIEIGTALFHYNHTLERTNNYYLNNEKIRETREKPRPPSSYYYGQGSIAYVTDNSAFGIASPMDGYRSRYQAETYIDGIKIYTLLLDQRLYYYMKPFSYAFRGYYYGRYGKDISSSRLMPLFLGYPTLVRGYDPYSFYYDRKRPVKIEQIAGTGILLGNFEIRLPFTGPARLSVIKSKFIFSELAVFTDGGIAFNPEKVSAFTIDENGNTSSPKPTPIFSSGISLRINLFGAIVLEPFFAIPFQRDHINNGIFGLNFSPGW